MIKVGIVEDNKEIRQALSMLISGSNGFECVCAYDNAEEALQHIPQKSPDVVLVDINLPGKSGIELISTLKPNLPRVQFVVLTVFDDSDNIFNALKAGATGYLLKSTPPTKIMDSIIEVYSGGSPMSSQIARKVINALSESQNRTKPDTSSILSKRESEILNLLAKGFRYKEIGEKLFISTETVRTHIRNIYQKLQVDSSIEAINKVYGKLLS